MKRATSVLSTLAALVLVSATTYVWRDTAASAAQQTPGQFAETQGKAKLDELARYQKGKRPLFKLEDAYPSWPLPAAGKSYGDFDGKRIMADLKEVTAISRKSKDDGVQYWGRIAGTKYDEMGQAWLEKKFQAIGLKNVRRQPFDLPPQWYPSSWEVSFDNGGTPRKLESAFPFTNTPATPAGGLDLETVYVGLGRASDFIGRDVKGKAAVIFSMPSPGVRDNSAQWFGSVERAQGHGAAAVIVVLGMPGNMQAQTPQPPSSVPAVTTLLLGNDDGTALMDAIDKSSKSALRIKIRLAADRVPNLKTATVWGELPGATDETILIQSTLDAFFEGAMDNASGLAVMVALAEHYAKVPQSQRRRTILFAGTPAHHAGDPGQDWMVKNKDTFFAKTALIINCVHIAQTQTTTHGPFLQYSNAIEPRRWTLRGSPLLESIAVNAYKEFGVTTFAEAELRGAGALSRIHELAPSLMIYSMSPFYHTTLDTPDAVPAPALQDAARAYARIIDEVNKVDRQALLYGEATK